MESNSEYTPSTETVENPAVDLTLKGMISFYGEARMRMSGNHESRSLLDQVFAEQVQQWEKDARKWAQKGPNVIKAAAAVEETPKKPLDTLNHPPITPETAQTL